MNAAEKERLSRLIDELDSMVPREGATIRLDQFVTARKGRFTANACGYLRFGIEFLKGAIVAGAGTINTQPTSGNEALAATCTVGSGSRPRKIQIDLEYLLASQPIVGFGEFLVDEDLKPVTIGPVQFSKREACTLGFFYILVVAILLFACVGIATVVLWLLK